MDKLLKWKEIIITQLVIYWITNIYKYYKLISIDLSKQIELKNPDLKQEINFIRRLERDDRATMFFIIEKSEETAFEFSQNSATIA